MALCNSIKLGNTFCLMERLGMPSRIRCHPSFKYCTDKTTETEEKSPAKPFEGLKKAVEMFSDPEAVKRQTKKPVEKKTFAHLLRHSNFIDLGDPTGKIVMGVISRVVENDLYIDFGWKFQTVCPAPVRNREDYIPGARVKLRIKDLELCGRFLGHTTDLTIAEADCTLLGILRK